MSNLRIALLHFPVYNKNGDVVTTCITGFDLHDIARTAYTYGVKKYYVVNSIPSQVEFAKRIIDCWQDEESNKINSTRVECFEIVEVRQTLEEVIKEIGKPLVVATSARGPGNLSFKELQNKINGRQEILLVFGTGWGLTPEFLKTADYVLEPICGLRKYNHLSVRGAVAVILDRLLQTGKGAG